MNKKWQFQILIVFIISLLGIGFWNSLKEKSELKNSKIEQVGPEDTARDVDIDNELQEDKDGKA